jgi:hypothetical protein
MTLLDCENGGGFGIVRKVILHPCNGSLPLDLLGSGKQGPCIKEKVPSKRIA